MAESWTKEEKAAIDAQHKAIEVAEQRCNSIIIDDTSTDEEIEDAEREVEEAHQELNDLIEDFRSNHEYDDDYF